MGNSCCTASDRKELTPSDTKGVQRPSGTSTLRLYYDEHKASMQADIRRLFDMQMNGTNLVEFRIIRKELNMKAAEDLAMLIPGLQGLTDVSLVWTSIDCRGCGTILEGLKLAQALENLCLNGNEVGNEGAAAVAKALPSLRRLRKLHLDSNTIGDKGAEAMADALSHAGSLTFLSLQSNKIGRKAQLQLIAAADAHPAMAEIQLQNNAGRVVLPPLTHVKVNADLASA